MSRGSGIYYVQFNQRDHFGVVFKEVAVILSFAFVSNHAIKLTAQLWSTFVYATSVIVAKIYAFAVYVGQTPLLVLV
jgi:hypothetical protein